MVGGEEEVEVVVEDVGGEEELKRVEAVVVRWETILPRAFVRVLLVEADGSTREIVAALLRKCGYRVSAAADGAKAWEVLIDEPHTIDLILTEVELPAMSGFNLLTMISEHESCKDIPVIMMSSHDSINMVFKCMLKGAADFLVKPIRKNELRNLWQHVWRRYSSNNELGMIDGNKDWSNFQQKLEDEQDNILTSNHAIKGIAYPKLNNEGCEKGSDNIRSCAMTGFEAMNTCMQNVQETKQILFKRMPVEDSLSMCEGAKEIKLAEKKQRRDYQFKGNLSSFISERNENNNKSITHDEKHVDSKVIDQNDTDQAGFCSKESEYTSDMSKLSNEIADLLGTMDERPWNSCNTQITSNIGCKTARGSKCDVHGNDQLDLSLRRCESSSCVPGNDACNMLKHSISSAFSRYKGRIVQFNSAELIDSQKEKKDSLRCSSQMLLNHCPLLPSCASQSNGVTLQSNSEDTSSTLMCLPDQEGKAAKNIHEGVPPFPIPAIAYDNLFSGFCFSLPPVVPTQLGAPPWCLNAMVHKPMALNVSNQSAPVTSNSEQKDYTQVAHPKTVIHNPEVDQVKNLESQEDETRYLSSVGGQIGDSSICDGSGSHLDGGECRSICGDNDHVSIQDVTMFSPEGCCGDQMVGHGESELTNSHRSILRQAALTKFRMKRKDRCFEKKVRYQSRKKLAEQRPRVKGQFVRQALAAPQ